ncbi:MAG TPA: hypothetical protein VI564_04035 [Candidatus Nanoarchaeia archaeon]|nr:hypothetical protein [Candidatus Nanoarchaeia archaeon]
MDAKKKRKFIERLVIGMHILNALIVVGFLIYVYIWYKRHR